MITLCSSSHSELVSGTLSSNSIEDGTEIRLVPAVESGVTVCTCIHVHVGVDGGGGYISVLIVYLVCACGYRCIYMYSKSLESLYMHVCFIGI